MEKISNLEDHIYCQILSICNLALHTVCQQASLHFLAISYANLAECKSFQYLKNKFINIWLWLTPLWLTISSVLICFPDKTRNMKHNPQRMSDYMQISCIHICVDVFAQIFSQIDFCVWKKDRGKILLEKFILVKQKNIKILFFEKNMQHSKTEACCAEFDTHLLFLLCCHTHYQHNPNNVSAFSWHV